MFDLNTSRSTQTQKLNNNNNRIVDTISFAYILQTGSCLIHDWREMKLICFAWAIVIVTEKSKDSQYYLLRVYKTIIQRPKTNRKRKRQTDIQTKSHTGL